MGVWIRHLPSFTAPFLHCTRFGFYRSVHRHHLFFLLFSILLFQLIEFDGFDELQNESVAMFVNSVVNSLFYSVFFIRALCHRLWHN